MSGIFAQWQPAWAEAGVASFPVDCAAKKPSVGNYLKAGIPASKQWAAKFPHANALGFACGRRNKITVVDIDAPGERLLADVLDKLGNTQVIVQTASGKHHAYYRHGGEGRTIRAPGFDGPVDILGNGYAVAPPSQSETGEYRFIVGSLADLANLPPIRNSLALNVPCSGAEAPVEPQGDSIPAGERNNTLWLACMSQAKNCHEVEQLARYAHEMNDAETASPLPQTEVDRLVRSAWEKTQAGENWFGTGSRVSIRHDDMDALLALGFDAFGLEMFLRRHHWGRNFFVANALAEHMPGGKWSRERFTSARHSLVHAGRLIVVRPASRAHGPALYRFAEMPTHIFRGEKGRQGERV